MCQLKLVYLFLLDCSTYLLVVVVICGRHSDTDEARNEITTAALSTRFYKFETASTGEKLCTSFKQYDEETK